MTSKASGHYHTRKIESHTLWYMYHLLSFWDQHYPTICICEVSVSSCFILPFSLRSLVSYKANGEAQFGYKLITGLGLESMYTDDQIMRALFPLTGVQ